MTVVVIRPVQVDAEWRWQCNTCTHVSEATYPTDTDAAVTGAKTHKCTHPTAPRDVTPTARVRRR